MRVTARSSVTFWQRLIGAGLVALALARPLPAGAADGTVAVTTRAWDHRQFGRMVFDLASGLDAVPVLADGTLTIRFSAPVEVALPLLNRRLTHWIEAGTLDGGARVLRFPVRVPASLKVDRVGRSLIIDLQPPQPVPPRPADAARPEGPPRHPAAAKAPAVPAAATVTEASPAAALAEALPAPAKLAVAPPAPVTAAPAALPPGPAGPAPVTLRDEATLTGTRLTITFDRPAAAAVFARGGALWLVFNRPGPLDLGPADHGFLGRLDQVPLEGGLALRLGDAAVLPAVAQDGNDWRLDFAAQGAAPARPIGGRPKPAAGGGMVMAYALTGATAPLTVKDPAIGDSIIVVPVAAPGPGVLEPAALSDFDLMASAAGLAIVPKADGIAVASGPEEVTVGAEAGTLTLSDAVAPPRPAQSGLAVTGALDVGQWMRSAEDMAALRRAVARAPEGARPALRLPLACALVARGLGAEALGEAALILEGDATAGNDPVFRQMRGIAAAMMGRADPALADLGLAALEFSADAALWQGFALADAQRPREAAEALAKGDMALDHYPAGQRDRLQAAMVEAALATDDLARAATVAARLSAQAATPGGRAAALALAGRLAQRQGDGAVAGKLFTAALETGDPAARVPAELGLIALGLADHSLAPAQAIARLDRLRFAWRGDARELEVLKRLGELQLGQGQWRDGLETLRRALRLFPDQATAGNLLAAQRAAFQRLFLDGAADALPPVQAVALYFDYRDLTPLGRDGDEMIRRLADRLTDVDLLDQAKALLQHQVDYRLTGIAQAQVAARLALLHLIDRDPADALAVLDRTEQPRLPDSLAAQRRLMRAKALSLLGHLDDARALIAGDRSPDGLQLAAEIAWAGRDWLAAAASLGGLVELRKADPAQPLDAETGALILRRAAALTLAGDQSQLAALGRRFGPAMAKTALADAFAGLTGGADSSPVQMRNLAQTLANGSGPGSFVDTLEARLREGPLSAIN